MSDRECKGCKYFYEYNLFCTHPDIRLDLTKHMISVGCDKKKEKEQYTQTKWGSEGERCGKEIEQ